MMSKYLKYEYFSPRSLKIVPLTYEHELSRFNNKIVEIKMGNDPLLELGEVIHHTYDGVTYKYKVNTIIKNKDDSFLAQESIINKSNSYMLPLIMSNRDKCLYNLYLYNTYINLELNKISLVYRFVKSDKYLEMESNFQKIPYFMKVSEFNNEYVIFDFAIPSAHKNDVKLFAEGKFSRLSKPAKNKILKFHPKQASKLIQILNQHEKRRWELEESLNITLPKDAELSTIPLETEYIEYFKNNVL